MWDGRHGWPRVKRLEADGAGSFGERYRRRGINITAAFGSGAAVQGTERQCFFYCFSPRGFRNRFFLQSIIRKENLGMEIVPPRPDTGGSRSDLIFNIKNILINIKKIFNIKIYNNKKNCRIGHVDPPIHPCRSARSDQFRPSDQPAALINRQL